MKKAILTLCVLCVLCFASLAAASGSYTSGDYMGVEGLGSGFVISKNATIRSTPSYDGASVASVPGGTEIHVTDDPRGGWVAVAYVEKGKRYEGYMREEYLVIDRLLLTLRRSNTPAYCAPSLEAKKVGSLAKYTQLDVIGTWGSFYIVSLRNAAAFIPMDADLWRSDDIKEWLVFSSNGVTTRETTLRTGPGDDWPEAETCKANTRLIVSTAHEEGDWYFVYTDDSKPAYARKSDVSLQ